MLTGSMLIFATDMFELCSTLSLCKFISAKLLTQPYQLAEKPQALKTQRIDSCPNVGYLQSRNSALNL